MLNWIGADLVIAHQQAKLYAEHFNFFFSIIKIQFNMNMLEYLPKNWGWCIGRSFILSILLLMSVLLCDLDFSVTLIADAQSLQTKSLKLQKAAVEHFKLCLTLKIKQLRGGNWRWMCSWCPTSSMACRGHGGREEAWRGSKELNRAAAVKETKNPDVSEWGRTRDFTHRWGDTQSDGLEISLQSTFKHFDFQQKWYPSFTVVCPGKHLYSPVVFI